MKNLIQITSAIAVIVLLAGCETTGLSPREQAGTSYPNYLLNLQSYPTNAPAQKLKSPVRLAVAQVGETAPPQSLLDQLTADRAQAASVIALPVPSDVDYSRLNRDDRAGIDYTNRINSLCSLARAGGARCLFLFGGTVDCWAKANAWSVFDWTIVGAYVVPGSRINLDGKAGGVLIDVETGMPMMFLNADAQSTGLSPDMLADGKAKQLQARMREELIHKLGASLLQKLALAQ